MPMVKRFKDWKKCAQWEAFRDGGAVKAIASLALAGRAAFQLEPKASLWKSF